MISGDIHWVVASALCGDLKVSYFWCGLTYFNCLLLNTAERLLLEQLLSKKNCDGLHGAVMILCMKFTSYFFSYLTEPFLMQIRIKWRGTFFEQCIKTHDIQTIFKINFDFSFEELKYEQFMVSVQVKVVHNWSVIVILKTKRQIFSTVEHSCAFWKTSHRSIICFKFAEIKFVPRL